MRVAIFGLGEVGALIAQDLIAAGVKVRAFDPGLVPTPVGVERRATPQTAVFDADMVMAFTCARDALSAVEQALDVIPNNTLYADFSTNSVAIKQLLAVKVASRKLDFADVALMSAVSGKGIQTPVLVSGTGAERFKKIVSELGMPVEIAEGKTGAASRKLLSSVMVRGLAAVMV